jgi:ubiquinol-cytochrome c reductase iron-sulfur subunit
MNPSADVLALASIEVDISAIAAGQAVKTFFRKQPLFIRHLTPAEIQAANAVDVSSLRDPQSLAERTKPGKPQWLITMGVCTHLGCVPLGAGEGENQGAVRRLFLPLPRLDVRHRGADPQRPGAQESRSARLRLQVGHRHSRRRGRK